jgi:hypothetical protein
MRSRGAPVSGSADARVVARREAARRARGRAAREAELHVLVAPRARVRRPAGQVLVDERRDDLSSKLSAASIT